MLTLGEISGRSSRPAKIAAVVCLAAVLAMAGVQALHMHAKTAPDSSLDPHCALCVLSHCVLQPQAAFVIALPARRVYRPHVARAPEVFVPRTFHWFVRPPPSV